MMDTYEHWVQRVVRDPTAGKPLSTGEIVKSSAGENFGVVEFMQINKPHFLAELGKKGDKYIYHFYPSEEILKRGAIVHDFYEPLGSALLEIFQRGDQIEADWVEEMLAWAVRVSGWTNHIWGDELAIRAVNRFEELLQERLVS
jgi:hypothetical protein